MYKIKRSSSTMKAVAGFLLLLVCASLADIRGECPMAAFYLELGCSPLEDGTMQKSIFSNNTNCPNAFKCPDLHPDPNLCYYKGVPYEDKTTIPQALINNPCTQACSCRVSGSTAQFECAAVDCVETFDTDMREQCVSTYELDSCCSVGNICGKDAIAKLSTCEVDDKNYKEGQPFEPKNTRKSCVCSSKWDGSLDNPEYCRDINCAIEIHYQYQLFNNCAPVFANSDNRVGCPIGFQCATSAVPTIRGLNTLGVNAKCQFGNVTLSVGDELEFPEECTRCSCSVPPFMSCYKKNKC